MWLHKSGGREHGGSAPLARRFDRGPRGPYAEIVGEMPNSHRQFLISFERGEADWTLLGVSGGADLPAVK
jgi:hypothetical protein